MSVAGTVIQAPGKLEFEDGSPVVPGFTLTLGQILPKNLETKHTNWPDMDLACPIAAFTE